MERARAIISVSIVIILLVVASIVVADSTVTFDSGGKIIASEVLRPGGNTDTGALRTAGKAIYLYEDLALGPTAAIDSGFISTVGFNELSILEKNGNTTQSRVVTLGFYDYSYNLYWWIDYTLAASGTGIYTVGHGCTGTGGTQGTNVALPAYIKITSAAPASGSGTGKIVAWAR